MMNPRRNEKAGCRMKIYRSDSLIGREKTIHIFTQSAETESEAHTHDFIEII